MFELEKSSESEMITRARRNTLGDILTRTTARFPQKLAFTFKNRQVTYQQLNALVNQTANGMREAGIQKENRLAILSKNSLDYVIVIFAAARLGAVLIPINYMLKEKDIRYMLKHSEVTCMLASNEYKDELDQAAQEANIKVEQRYLLEAASSINGWISITELQDNKSNADVEETIMDDDLAQILYTSGTESEPKGVMLSHKSIISEYVSCIFDGHMSSQDKLVHALPFYHSAQLHVFLGPSVYIGASGIILDQASPQGIMETIQKHKANQLFAPPTVWIALLRHADFDSFDLSSLEKCYYGAAIMPKEILKELDRRLPNAKFWNFYGQTEVAPLATALQPEDQLRKLGSAGTPTLNMETKIVNDQDEEVPRGEVGEIVHRTPHAMLGYLKAPEKTAEAFRNGWFHSGDLGTMDEDGYTTIVDRKKDMINTGGENVPSREVEEIIYQMEEVAEVAVIGVTDPYWIEAITAVIAVKDGATVTEDAVRAFCTEGLSKFKVPKSIHFMEALPKNPSGKVLKKDLRDKYEQKQA